MNLNFMDVQDLINEPSIAARGALAIKVAATFRAGTFTNKESAIAADIFRLVLKDAEKKIREGISQQLCDSPTAPHDVIFSLACDESSVAENVLRFSSVLTEDDLIEIAQSTQEVMKLCAIAQRDHVPERLSDVLIDGKQQAVLRTLFENRGARLGEHGLAKAWDSIQSSHTLLEVLVKRGGLPVAIAERIYSVVSGELQAQILKQYKFHSPMVQKAVGDAREWELLGIMPVANMLNPDIDEQVEDLVDQLYANGRLTHSLLIRALCTGSLNLFEAGIARMAGVPRVNARILLMGGSKGFHAIYKAAAMPEGFTDAVEKLLNIVLELSEYGHCKPEDFRKRVFDRVYIEGYHRSVEGMGYLLSIIGGRLQGSASSSQVH